jgi:NAD-dependent DNA ligase
MPSEKLTRILKARSPFSPEQIEEMREADGWQWVYAQTTPHRVRLPSVCFTGFSQANKDKLSAIARGAHLSVVGSVNKSLSFLCAGENAGAAKVAKAHEQGITILNQAEFENLVETGEIPDR